MKRLFFGLSVDPVVGQSLIRAARRALGPELTRAIYGEDDLHLTLCFIGSFPDDRIASLKDMANGELRSLWAPELLLGADGDAFPDRETPRTLHTKVEETSDSVGRLATLRNRAMQVAMSHGWRPTQAERARPFQPHVTLARLGRKPSPTLGATPEKAAEQALEQSAKASEMASSAEEFWDLGAERRWLPIDITLYESPGQTGAGERYLPIAAWPLAVRPG
ncbi:MAG: 2'-5' RNA ligase [Planctomycetota bacterium]|jgi:2'-5' RNA ligase